MNTTRCAACDRNLSIITQITTKIWYDEKRKEAISFSNPETSYFCGECVSGIADLNVADTPALLRSPSEFEAPCTRCKKNFGRCKYRVYGVGIDMLTGKRIGEIDGQEVHRLPIICLNCMAEINSDAADIFSNYSQDVPVPEGWTPPEKNTSNLPF